MNDAADLLAVCIPTYRRPELLRACVESVIRSGAAFNTPVYVVDDSTDDTNVAVLESLRRAYPPIHHVRNSRNLGIDGNIVHAVNSCRARYAWLLGEDDQLVPEAIAEARKLLERAVGAWPFVYVNYASLNEDFSRILKPRSLALDRDEEQNAAQFLAESAWSMGFIGACIIDRAAWGAIDASRYIGTWFAHVGVIGEVCHGKSVHLIARPLVWNRCGSTAAFTWTGSMMQVLAGWGRMVDLLEPLYGADVCRRARDSFERAHGLRSVKFLAYARAGGALTPEVVREHLRARDYPLSYRTAAEVLARVPASWCRQAQRCWHAWTSRVAGEKPDD